MTKMGKCIMPSIGSDKFDPPRDFKEFEYMVADYARTVYKCRASLFGRSGQRQDGIDIIVENVPYTGIQCKDYQITSVDEHKIDKWIEDAENNPINIGKLIIAIATDTDAKIQRHVLTTSKKRKREGKFEVSVLFWEEIIQVIMDNPVLMKKYYLHKKPGKNAKDTLVIRDEVQLIEGFQELVVKYHVMDMLRADAVEGFSIELPCMADDFIAELKLLLDRAIALAFKSDVYKTISDFGNSLISFISYLSCHCCADNNSVRFRIMPYPHEYESFKEESEKLRYGALSLLGQILKH